LTLAAASPCRAVEQVRKELPGAKVEYMMLNLSSFRWVLAPPAPDSS
jgi:hypothetical protein